MDKEKMKLYLVEVKGLSPEEADAKIAAMSEEELKALEDEIVAWALAEASDEGDGDSEGEGDTELGDGKTGDQNTSATEKAKKEVELAAKEEEDKKEKEQKLSAAKTKLTKLSGDFRASAKLMQLTAKRGKILTRLSKLQAEAKITPAEVKKINLVELSAKSDEAVDAVLKAYADREPVLLMGQVGTRKGENIAKLAGQQKMTELEARTRSNMSFLSQAERNNRESRLASGLPASDTPIPVEHVLDPAATAETANLDAEYDSIVAMLDAGDIQGAKDALKALLSKIAAGATAEFTDSQNAETERQLSTLQQGMAKMQTQFNEVMELAGSLAAL